MITYLKQLSGNLQFGQYKSINCKVDLEIDQHEEDEWAKPDLNYNPDNYINGIRVTGEFNFDTSPIDWRTKHPVVLNAIGQLTIHQQIEDAPLHLNISSSSKFNILITEKISEIDLVPKKIKRYFWQFFIVGKPVWDNINIFPNDYIGVKMNRIFYCTNFRGYWPASVSSVIVAKDKEDARQILTTQLKLLSIPIEDSDDFILDEINLNKREAIILNNGEWQ